MQEAPTIETTGLKPLTSKPEDESDGSQSSKSYNDTFKATSLKRKFDAITSEEDEQTVLKTSVKLSSSDKFPGDDDKSDSNERTENGELKGWLETFCNFNTLTRQSALNALVSCQTLDCEELRQLRDNIDYKLRFDIVRNVPYEIALYIMSFLKPKELGLAAQTCRYYRTLCEDNRIWREKCREEGLLNQEETFNDLFKKRIHRTLNNRQRTTNNDNDSTTPCSTSSDFQRSGYKSAYLRQLSIIKNWQERNFDMNAICDSYGHKKQHFMRLRCHEEHVITCLQFNPISDLIVSGSDDFTLKVWSATTGRCLRTLRGHAGGVWSSQLSPENIIISGSTDRTMRVWDATSGELIHTFFGHTSTVRCLALDGNLVVSGSRDATLRLWSIKPAECKQIFTGHEAAVRCVEYKNDLIISGAYDNLVKVWNAKTGLCLHSLEAHESRIYSLQFNGNIIASGSLDTTICIWSVKTGVLQHRLEGHTSLTSKMILKSNILVSANADSYCKIWDINTGECLRTLEGENKHTSAITSVYFNSRFVVTSSDDGTIKLWNLKTGEFIRNLIVLPTAGKGGVVWRIRASNTKLVCAVGSRTADTEDTHLLVLDFDDNYYYR